jgi:hypothetical protein
MRKKWITYVKESALAIKKEKKILQEMNDAFSEELDEALCVAINKVAKKFVKTEEFSVNSLTSKQANVLIVKVLIDQLHYAIHEERRF